MYNNHGEVRRTDSADILIRRDLGPYSCTNLMTSVSSLGVTMFRLSTRSKVESDAYPHTGFSMSLCSRRLRGPKYHGPVCNCKIPNAPSATEMNNSCQ